MITLRQLRYFEQLARNLHFGRAAEACAVTQPALSMQIRDLEAELGGPLVERAREGVKLTELGEDVAERATSILAAVRDLETRARIGTEGLAGPIRLGVIPSIAPYLLPRLLPAIRERHPQAQLSLRETQTAALMRELVAGDLDAVVMSLPIDEPEVEGETLFDDAFLLAVPATSSLAERNAATVEQLDDEELLLLEDGHCFRDQALTVCRTIDPRRLKSFGATSLTTLMQLVANGQGITLLPRLFVDSEAREDPRVRLLRFADPEPKRTLALVFRKTSPAKAERGRSPPYLQPMPEKTRPTIARVWRGRTVRNRADDYAAYLYEHGIRPLEEKALGVQQFREDRESETEFVTISYWESVEAMSRFAGPDPNRIHHLERDAEFLIELPESVQVLTVASSSGDTGGS